MTNDQQTTKDAVVDLLMDRIIEKCQKDALDQLPEGFNRPGNEQLRAMFLKAFELGWMRCYRLEVQK